MLGLFAEFTPKFVKRYRRLGEEIREAAREYADEVRSGGFPAEEHTYRAPRRAKSATGAVASDGLRSRPSVLDDKALQCRNAGLRVAHIADGAERDLQPFRAQFGADIAALAAVEEAHMQGCRRPRR